MIHDLETRSFPYFGLSGFIAILPIWLQHRVAPFELFLMQRQWLRIRSGGSLTGQCLTLLRLTCRVIFFRNGWQSFHDCVWNRSCHFTVCVKWIHSLHVNSCSFNSCIRDPNLLLSTNVPSLLPPFIVFSPPLCFSVKDQLSKINCKVLRGKIYSGSY